MAEILWVQIKSWHVVRFDDSSVTACGLEIDPDSDEIVDDYPRQEATCENCFRLVMPKLDKEASPA